MEQYYFKTLDSGNGDLEKREYLLLDEEQMGLPRVSLNDSTTFKALVLAERYEKAVKALKELASLNTYAIPHLINPSADTEKVNAVVSYEAESRLRSARETLRDLGELDE